LPAGEGEAIDYIDFFQLNGGSYDAARIPVGSSQLGQVIGRIRCSLIASENLHRGPAAIINGTASFLPAGAPVYRVHGYPSACRLAAYLHGQLQVYIAQASVKGQKTARPLPPPSPRRVPGRRQYLHRDDARGPGHGHHAE
jgi:hypothetical protein